MSALLISSTEDFDNTEVDIETRLSALSLWWAKHCRSFTMWYLSLNAEQQKEVITKTEVWSNQLPAGNWLLPEFDEQADSLLGRALCILMTSRLASVDLSMSDDVNMLETVRTAGQLPDLSSGQLSQLQNPFVDPLDPTQSIQALSTDSSKEVVDQVESWLSSGRLVRAEVWLVLQLRRAALCTFFEALTKVHQQAMPADSKPSPTYLALLRAEKQMRSQAI